MYGAASSADGREFRVVGVVRTAAPASEPITLAEAKLHLRVDGDDEDALIAEKLSAAIEFIESATGLALITQTFRATLDGFPLIAPYKIELPRSPAVSLTSVKYDDDDGVEQTYTGARLDINTVPARVFPSRADGTWPSIEGGPSAVRLLFVAGGAAADVSPRAKAAILLMLGHFFENREATIAGTIIAELPLGLQTLLGQLKVRSLR